MFATCYGGEIVLGEGGSFSVDGLSVAERNEHIIVTYADGTTRVCKKGTSQFAVRSGEVISKDGTPIKWLRYASKLDSRVIEAHLTDRAIVRAADRVTVLTVDDAEKVRAVVTATFYGSSQEEADCNKEKFLQQCTCPDVLNFDGAVFSKVIVYVLAGTSVAVSKCNDVTFSGTFSSISVAAAQREVGLHNVTAQSVSVDDTGRANVTMTSSRIGSVHFKLEHGHIAVSNCVITNDSNMKSVFGNIALVMNSAVVVAKSKMGSVDVQECDDGPRVVANTKFGNITYIVVDFA